MRTILTSLVVFILLYSAAIKKLSFGCCESWSARLLQSTGDYVVTYSVIREDQQGVSCSPLCNWTWSTSGSGLDKKYPHVSVISQNQDIWQHQTPNPSLGDSNGTLTKRSWEDGYWPWSNDVCNFTSSQSSQRMIVETDSDTGTDCTVAP